MSTLLQTLEYYGQIILHGDDDEGFTEEYQSLSNRQQRRGLKGKACA